MYLALDIETLEKPIPEEDLEAFAKKSLENNSRKYKKQETIEYHVKDDVKKFKESWKFGRRGARILCIGMGLFSEDNKLINHHCEPSENEAEVLLKTFEWLDSLGLNHGAATLETEVYTYNGDNFDIPIIIKACANNDIYPSRPFNSRKLIDLMKYPLERFMKSETLDGLFSLYGGKNSLPLFIPAELKEFYVEEYPEADGSLVAKMWEDDEDGGNRVASYCMQDIVKTGFVASKVRQFIK